MPPFFISLITLVCVLLGLVVGLFLRRLLPEHHLKDDSKDVLKTTSGLIATLVALVLGLLVASTKGTFDTANIMLMQEGAKFITLDRYLAAYGPEARPLQKLLKNSLEKGIQRMCPGVCKPFTVNLWHFNLQTRPGSSSRDFVLRSAPISCNLAGCYWSKPSTGYPSRLWWSWSSG